MWTQCTSVTDRQTDGRTDGQTDRITITKTVQGIASHGKNNKNNKTEACITNAKCHHKYHMSTMDHINQEKGLEQRGR